MQPGLLRKISVWLWARHIIVLSAAKTSEEAWCKPHTTMTGCWWHPEGPSCIFSHPDNTSASEPWHLYSTAGLSGNEARSTQVGYGAQYQTCTPCTVLAWICREAETISYSHCWIMLLSETTVCFWGLKTVPPLWTVLSTIPWHKWHPCASSIPAVTLEQDLGAPLALSQPHSSHQTLAIMSSFAQSCALKTPDT